MNKIFSIFVLLLIALIIGCSSVTDKIPITTSSEQAREYFVKGRDLLEKLRAVDANDYFMEAVSLDSNFALAWMYLAFTQTTNREAFAMLDKALALKDKVSEGERLLILATSAQFNNRQQEQLEYLKELVKQYPDDERAINNLAGYYFARQEYDQATKAYRRAIEINEEFSQPYNQLGYIYRFRNEYDSAIASFEKYIELIPNDPNPYDSYADLLMKMGKYGLSIENYYEALRHDPNFVVSNIGIAYNLCLLGKHKDARGQLREMFQTAENDAQRRQALMATAVTYVDEGDYGNAVKQFDKMYGIAEKDGDVLSQVNDRINQGTIYLEKGEPDKALTKYNDAIAMIKSADISEERKNLFTNNMQYFIGRVAIDNGDLGKADKIADDFSKYAEETSNAFQTWQAHNLKGRIALAKKEYNLAIEELVRSNMQSPSTLYLLANAYRGLNDLDKARQYYDEAGHYNSFINPMDYAFVRLKALYELRQLQES